MHKKRGIPFLEFLFFYCLLGCIQDNSMPAATSSATAFPRRFSMMAKAKSNTSPGPFPVITCSDASTATPVTSAPISFISKPG